MAKFYNSAGVNMDNLKRTNYLREPLLDVTKNFFENLEVDYPFSLAERHPHILNAICDLWSTPIKAKQYLDNLIFSEAGQQGFSKEVFKEITQIQIKYDELYPEDNTLWTDPKVKK